MVTVIKLQIYQCHISTCNKLGACFINTKSRKIMVVGNMPLGFIRGIHFAHFFSKLIKQGLMELGRLKWPNSRFPEVGSR